MADIARQFARLAVEYGDAKISTEAKLGLLEREWFEAFSAFSPRLLHQAVTACIEGGQYWPRISEVRKHLLALRGEVVWKWSLAARHGVYRASQENDPPPPTDEERARVAAALADFKRRMGAAA